MDQRIAELLDNPSKAVLTLHRRPDGDSVGSNMALVNVLKARGHTVDVFCIDPVPEYLSFIPGTDVVRVQSPLEIRWHDYDVYWALDMSAPDMLGEQVSFPKDLEIVVIDHHRTNQGWGVTNLVEPESISTASVLYSLFDRLKITMNVDMGLALLTGLATDSGFFSYIENAAPLRTAADIIERTGANYQNIVFNIQRHTNLEDVLFLGNALTHMQVDYEKKIAWLPIPNKSWVNYGLAGQNSHMLTGYIQSINGTDIGIMIIEEKPGAFRVQFRSRDRSYDVSALAAKFGGGGHKNAAGAKLTGDSIEEVMARIAAEV
jgi:phosphoesterase RecJ-like protein